MLYRSLLNLLIIWILLLNFLILPNQVSAQTTCSQCEVDSNNHRIICFAPPVFPIGTPACLVTVNASRLICVRNCTPDATGSAQLLQYCHSHPEDSSCTVPVSNGNFCEASHDHLRTAIGCVPTSLNGFFQGIIRYSFIIAGTIALILMILGAFQMMTSAGNPEGIKKGREQFIAAASGLVFVLLSTALLRIIGVDILGIPNF